MHRTKIFSQTMILISMLLVIAGCATTRPEELDSPELTDYRKKSSGIALPESCEQLLLKEQNFVKILNIHNFTYKRIKGFDFIGASVEAEQNDGFEGVYYQTYVFRKSVAEANWKNAQLYRTEMWLFKLFALDEVELQKALIKIPQFKSKVSTPSK